MSHLQALTGKYLAALKPSQARYDVVDESRRGLTLRVSTPQTPLSLDGSGCGRGASYGKHKTRRRKHDEP